MYVAHVLSTYILTSCIMWQAHVPPSLIMYVAGMYISIPPGSCIMWQAGWMVRLMYYLPHACIMWHANHVPPSYKSFMWHVHFLPSCIMWQAQWMVIRHQSYLIYV